MKTIKKTDINKMIMSNYTAAGIIEGIIEADYEEQVIEAWQHLVNTGFAWTLPGQYGRTAMQLIEEGIINGAE